MKFSVFQQEMEHARQRKSSREGWVEERCLGTGTFGTVMLFENKVSLLTLYTPLSVYKYCSLYISYGTNWENYSLIKSFLSY